MDASQIVPGVTLRGTAKQRVVSYLAIRREHPRRPLGYHAPVLRRAGYLLGLLVLLALAAAWGASYGPTTYVVQPQTPGRWYGVMAHRGRIILATEAVPVRRWWGCRVDGVEGDFLDRYVPREQFVGSVPIWPVMLVVGALLAWRWLWARLRSREVAGFPLDHRTEKAETSST